MSAHWKWHYRSLGVSIVSHLCALLCRYFDPQYFLRSQLTTGSDVYSFGVVLLELISGRQAIEFSCPKEDESNLIEWVRSLTPFSWSQLLFICISGDLQLEMLKNEMWFKWFNHIYLVCLCCSLRARRRWNRAMVELKASWILNWRGTIHVNCL